MENRKGIERIILIAMAILLVILLTPFGLLFKSLSLCSSEMRGLYQWVKGCPLLRFPQLLDPKPKISQGREEAQKRQFKNLPSAVLTQSILTYLDCRSLIQLESVSILFFQLMNKTLLPYNAPHLPSGNEQSLHDNIIVQRKGPLGAYRDQPTLIELLGVHPLSLHMEKTEDDFREVRWPNVYCYRTNKWLTQDEFANDSFSHKSMHYWRRRQFVENGHIAPSVKELPDIFRLHQKVMLRKTDKDIEAIGMKYTILDPTTDRIWQDFLFIYQDTRTSAIWHLYDGRALYRDQSLSAEVEPWLLENPFFPQGFLHQSPDFPNLFTHKLPVRLDGPESCTFEIDHVERCIRLDPLSAERTGRYLLAFKQFLGKEAIPLDLDSDEVTLNAPCVVLGHHSAEEVSAIAR